MTLEEKLALSKEQQQKIEKGIKAVSSKQNKNTAQTMIGSLDTLDEAVFGDAQPSDPNRYDAEAEMKRIKERYEHGAKIDCSNSRIPQSIIRSILDNPLDMPSVDPKMDAFTERLKEKLPEGLGRSYEIQSKLEKQDKQIINENSPKSSESSTRQAIDYEMIKLIIENAIEKKMETLKNCLLVENKQTNDASLKAMKLGNKFLFLDSDNNVFECQMKYIGKNKKKQ